MATKIATTIVQSEKLAEILPIESADMYWSFGNIKFMDNDYDSNVVQHIPAWSLAALLNIIPTMIGSVFEKDALRLRMDKSETDFNIWYDNLDTVMVEEGFDIIETNPVDACVEMIIKLNEKGLL